MSDRRPSAFDSTFLRAAVCALAVCTLALSTLAGCAGEPEQKDQQLRKARSAKPTVEVKKPSPEELANTPCGNPDWAQLPPGAEDKAPAQRPAQQEGPADGAEDGEDASDDEEEQSNRGERSPSDQPCT